MVLSPNRHPTRPDADLKSKSSELAMASNRNWDVYHGIGSGARVLVINDNGRSAQHPSSLEMFYASTENGLWGVDKVSLSH